MSSSKALDPENSSYDIDGSSDTDESYTEGSETEDEAVKSNIFSADEKERKFRKPIMFYETQVSSAIQESPSLKNYMEVNSRILDYGIILCLPDHIVNVAIIYGLRFQMMCPRNNFTAVQKAAACIFLASKSEDSVRRLDSIAGTFHRLEITDSKSVDARKIPEVIKLLETFVLTVEGFQVNMRHPHRILEQYNHVLNLSKKMLTNAHFATTAIIQMTLSILQHPMNHIGAVALRVAAKFCGVTIESPSSKPWYQTIEANKDLSEKTIDAIYTDFMKKFNTYKKYVVRLNDWKKKTGEFSPFHRNSTDPQSDRNRSADKRRDGKSNWHSANSVERRDNRNQGYSLERHNSSWSMSRKPTSDRMNYSGAVRSHTNSSSPSRYSGDDRLSSNHSSHGRYSSHTGDKTHFSPSKMRMNEHVPSANSHPGHKRSFDGGIGDSHQASNKHRKM